MIAMIHGGGAGFVLVLVLAGVLALAIFSSK